MTEQSVVFNQVADYVDYALADSYIYEQNSISNTDHPEALGERNLRTSSWRDMWTKCLHRTPLHRFRIQSLRSRWLGMRALEGMYIFLCLSTLMAFLNFHTLIDK